MNKYLLFDATKYLSVAFVVVFTISSIAIKYEDNRIKEACTGEDSFFHIGEEGFNCFTPGRFEVLKGIWVKGK